VLPQGRVYLARARALILGNEGSRKDLGFARSEQPFGGKDASAVARDHSRDHLQPELENFPARDSLDETGTLRTLLCARPASKVKQLAAGRGGRRAGKTRVKAHLTRQRKLIGHLRRDARAAFYFRHVR